MTPPLVYVAGPFTALLPDGSLDWLGIERNIRRAEDVGVEVAKCGAYPVIPHTNTRGHFSQLQPAAFWYEGTKALMGCTKAVQLVDGWNRSTGTLGEIEEAIRREMPIFLPGRYEALAAWVRDPILRADIARSDIGVLMPYVEGWRALRSAVPEEARP